MQTRPSPFQPGGSGNPNYLANRVRPTIIIYGVNRNLTPQKATTLSYGTDWTPKGVLDGLTVSATYYYIDFTDKIQAIPFYQAVLFTAPVFSSAYVLNPTLDQPKLFLLERAPI